MEEREENGEYFLDLRREIHSNGNGGGGIFQLSDIHKITRKSHTYKTRNQIAQKTIKSVQATELV